MSVFIAEHMIEIFFGLVSAGLLAFCKYLSKQLKNYKNLLDKKESDDLTETIESRLEPIKEEIEQLRKYIRDTANLEQRHIDLIVSSYRFRLVQLCREYLKQGYMTQAQYEQLVEFFKVYRGLGGNGQAEEYYNKAIELPIRPEEEV